MEKRQSRIYTSLWVLPLLIPIIRGGGEISEALGFRGIVMVTYWISLIPNPSDEERCPPSTELTQRSSDDA
jgi:hypothetical protein